MYNVQVQFVPFFCVYNIYGVIIKGNPRFKRVPHSQDKREGISKNILSFSTLYFYTYPAPTTFIPLPKYDKIGLTCVSN